MPGCIARGLAMAGVACLALLTSSCSSSASPSGSPASSGSPAPPPSGLLGHSNLLYGSEIGAWEINGGSAVTNPTIVREIRAAKVSLIRYSVYDCFTGQRCGRDNHAGTQSEVTFQDAIRGITKTDGAIPWIKFLPVARGNIRGTTGQIFCPPGDGSDWGMNVPADKQVLAAIAAVYKGPIVLEDNNEAEYDCARFWGFSSDGDPGVSTDLGHLFAATMPPLLAYAKTLGFSDVVSVGYIGISGGPGWNDPCAATSTAPFGYSCSIPNTYIDEFNRAAHAAYVTSGEKPDYIPEVESVHSYCHSPDFTSATGYPVPDAECYAWQRQWITAARQEVDSIWGDAIGNQIRFAVSEWSGGAYNKHGNSWAGFTNGDMPRYVAGYLKTLRGDGVTTGDGDGYWSATLFNLSSNPQGNGYNLIQPDGKPSDYYPAFRSASLGGQ
jgi:hypothetical protein